jgi:hypothetical protein
MKAICSRCKKVVNAQNVNRDAELGLTGKIAKALPVHICGECGLIVSIPHKSVDDVKRALESSEPEQRG